MVEVMFVEDMEDLVLSLLELKRIDDVHMNNLILPKSCNYTFSLYFPCFFDRDYFKQDLKVNFPSLAQAKYCYRT